MATPDTTRSAGYIVLLSVLVLCALTIIIMASAPAGAVSVDASTYSVRNPKITVNYTDPVFLVTKKLIAYDPENPVHDYPLCQIPQQQEQQSYVKAYTLYTREDADPATCAGTPVFLVPGEYQLTLMAVDPQGNPTKPNSIDIIEFIINGIDIELITPASGIANRHPFDIYFLTNNETVCRYSFTNRPFDQSSFETMLPTQEGNTPSMNHNVRTVDYRGDMFILCQEPTGRLTPAKFVIGWDTTPPRITPNATPAKVIDPRFKYTSVAIKTDEETTCWFDGQILEGENPSNYRLYSTTHEFVHFYADITDNAEHNFSYPVKCRNLAGLESTAQLNVTVNFGDFVFIDVLNPPELTNELSFDVRARPTFIADACELNGEIMAVDEEDDTVFVAPVAASEGKNILSLNCTGAKNASRTYNVTVDSTPPSEPTINASGKICANTITARFNTTDTTGVLSYTYEVSDARGTIARKTQLAQLATVTLSRPVDPPLRWEVYATDLAQNNGSAAMYEIAEPEEGADEECGFPPFITIKEPNLGFARTKPYTLTLGTVRASECRYTLQQGVAWSAMTAFSASADKLTHSKSGLLFADTMMHVACNETDGTYHRKSIHVGMDNTTPRIAALADPNPVIDPTAKIVKVTVTTDDDTYCTHNSTDGPQFTTTPDTSQSAYMKEHTTLFDYRSITSSATQRRTVQATCKNLAYAQNSTTFTIIIDLGANLSINVLSPSRYTADSDIVLKVKPNKMATCTWQRTGSTDAPAAFTTVDTEANTHEESLGELEEGGHSYIIECTAADGVGTTVAQFVVDRTPPAIEDLVGPSIICPATPAVYHYNVTGFDQDPIISYALERSDGTGASFQDNTTDAIITLAVTGMDPGEYTLTVTPINHANVTGTPGTLDVEIKSRTDEACVQTDDHCTNSQLDPGEEGPDCGGTCPNACITCYEDVDCPEGMSCTEGYCVNTDACTDDSGCQSGEQCQNGECTRVVCTANSQCAPESICVEGACVLPPSCATDDDCAAGYTCAQSMCVLPECGNGIKDEGETAADCGGSCPACIACTDDSICTAPETCQGGVCANPANCTVNADCGTERVCLEGDCVPVAVCASDSDCPDGKVCSLHVCNEPEGGCSSDDDCDIDAGEVCTYGVCEVPGEPSGCTTDDDCDTSSGETCNTFTGQCERDIPSDPCDNGVIDIGEESADCGGSCPACIQCTGDSDCPYGKICDAESGVCIPGSTPQPPVDDEKKSYLLSILLIVFGIAIMGGAGYFLYEQNEEKRAIAMREALAAHAAQTSRGGRPGAGGMGGIGGPGLSSPGAGPARPALDPQTLAKMRAEQAAKAQAIREELAKRNAEKAAQRSSLFSGFDGLVDGDAARPAARTVVPTAAPATGSALATATSAGTASAASGTSPASKDAADDDDFVDLEALAKKKKSESQDGRAQDAKTGAPVPSTKKEDTEKEGAGASGKDIKKDGAKDGSKNGSKDGPKREEPKDDAFSELDKL